MMTHTLIVEAECDCRNVRNAAGVKVTADFPKVSQAVLLSCNSLTESRRSQTPLMAHPPLHLYLRYRQHHM